MRPLKPLLHVVLAGALAVSSLHCSGDDGGQPGASSAVNVSAEHKAGDLQYTFPERGAFIEQGSTPTIDINGKGASPALTINGQPARVNKDGTWSATITPTVGINIIKAVDGEFANDTAFLYGHFVKFTESLPQGIALILGVDGVSGKDPVGSLSTVASLFLKGRTDLFAALRGFTTNGSSGPVNYSARVDNVKNGAGTVQFAPAAGGLQVTVTIKDINATGSATGKSGFINVTKPYTAHADQGVVTGLAKLTVSNGAIKATIPNATTRLDGFHIDVSGLPGAADDWLSGKVRPAIESAAVDYVKADVPKMINLTLDGLGMPKQLDLQALQMDPVPVATTFDGVDFTKDGGSLTAAARFGVTEYNGGQPGVRAPGWLELSKAPTQKRPPSAAASVSLDTLNQLFLAVWGNGSLARAVPDVASFSGLRVDPMLPAVVTPGDSDGTLKVALGDVMIEGMLNNAPFTAAATILQDVTPAIDKSDLIITPKGDADLSITWLKADDIPDTLRKTVQALAGTQLQNFLKTLRLPIPSINLNGLGAGFTGQMLKFDQPALTVDEAAARIDIAGTLKIAK